MGAGHIIIKILLRFQNHFRILKKSNLLVMYQVFSDCAKAGRLLGWQHKEN